MPVGNSWMVAGVTGGLQMSCHPFLTDVQWVGSRLKEWKGIGMNPWYCPYVELWSLRPSAWPVPFHTMYIRARVIKLRYGPARSASRPSFYAVRHILRINHLRKQMQKVSKKVFRKFGGYVLKQYFCTRFRERNADEHWNDGKQSWGWTTGQKKLFEKNFWKVLVVQKKSLPLHPLSKRKP